MGKIIVFTAVVFLILLFPFYENEKINIKKIVINFDFPLTKIENGSFFIYKENLIKKGTFEDLNIYKDYYLTYNLNLSDLLNHEKLFSKKAFLKRDILKLYNIKYKNEEYNLFSEYAVYNLKTKDIKGNKFLINSSEYNGSGKSFYVDKKRDIKATYVSFNIKVEK